MAIARTLAGSVERISMVYSDPDPHLSLDAPCELIRTPNELFWANKFKHCVDACDADILLVIHGDTSCDSWPGLVASARKTFSRFRNIGAWAPYVDGTQFTPEVTQIGAIAASSLKVVVVNDGIVFAISRPVVNRMRSINYEENIYGWGISYMISAYCYDNKLMAVLDSGLLVRHPKERGYDSSKANEMMVKFMHQLAPSEYLQFQMINFYRFGKMRFRQPQ
ncbi:MAG: hypothetical protein PHR30_03860 [Gallionellaceae bacterium]|nr:hypothetical protein [Gallionellaceae bacterium]